MRLLNGRDHGGKRPIVDGDFDPLFLGFGRLSPRHDPAGSLKHDIGVIKRHSDDEFGVGGGHEFSITQLSTSILTLGIIL